jgi:hypothetical protein
MARLAGARPARPRAAAGSEAAGTSKPRLGVSRASKANSNAARGRCRGCALPQRFAAAIRQLPLRP